MNPIRNALLAVIALAAFAAPAAAWPYIDVTASEVLSVDPPRWRTTFEMSHAGYQPEFDSRFFEIEPIDPSTLHLFECGAPAGWNCGASLPAESGGRYFSGYAGPVSFPAAFSIVSDSAAPCVRIWFFSVVLDRVPGPTLDTGYMIEACLVLDAPVPAVPATWGSLKSQYR